MMLIEIPMYIETVVKQQAEIQGITAEQVVQKALASQFKIERPFNFEIDEIDKALNGKFVEIPKGIAKDFDSFTKWLDGEFA